MSRSETHCRACQALLGRVNRTSRVLHPVAPLVVLFIDHERKITEVACPACGARITVRCLRIDLTEPPTETPNAA